MKKVLFILLLAAVRLPAQGIIDFKISKPVCLLTFLLAANHDANISPTYSAYIYSHLPKQDSASFSGIVKAFSSISLSYGYTIPGYPENRIWPRTTFNLISIAAVQASDLNDFLQRIMGILPNEDWLKLRNVLQNAAPYYDKMIGDPCASAAKMQLSALQKLGGKADSIFIKLRAFYGSVWSADIPFTVSMYPLPGEGTNTTASPHSNNVVLAEMATEKDPPKSLSIAIHEMCHMLYLEQSLAMQVKIDGYFSQNTSRYSMYAYGYFDEALATACGNGWAYKALSGKMEVRSWYANEYINGYAHAIYPMVERYINEGRVPDKYFVDSAVSLFGKGFPGAIYNYGNLLNSVAVYTDAKDHEQMNSVVSTINRYFTMRTFGVTYPIADPQSVSMIDESPGTQFFVIHSNRDENYKLLKSKFPQLKNLSVKDEGVINFFDDKKRPVIIVNVGDLDKLDTALSMMANAKEMNPDKIYTPL